MRVRIGALVLVCFLLGAPAVFSDDNRIIVPGKRMGWVTLGMDFSKVLAAFGTPDHIARTTWEKIYTYGKHKLTFDVDNKWDKIIRIKITNPVYYIPPNVHVGATMSDAISVLGKPGELIDNSLPRTLTAKTEMSTTRIVIQGSRSGGNTLNYHGGTTTIFTTRDSIITVIILSLSLSTRNHLRETGTTGGVCYVCGRRAEADEGTQVPQSNIFFCGACLDTGMTRPALVNTLYTKVREICDRKLDFRVTPPPNLALDKLEKDVLGLCEKIRTPGGTVIGSRLTITYDLKVVVLMGTIAHEYAHAWHIRYSPAFSNRKACEGFATWVEDKFYRAIGQHTYAAYALENLTPPFYLEGYRIVRDYEMKHGSKGTFDAVLKGRFPGF